MPDIVKPTHTQLNVRNFSSFATTMLWIGMVSVAFGAVDLIFMGPFGSEYIAGVGQGDLIVAGMSALFLGVVDGFSSRLAEAEGSGKSERIITHLMGGVGLLLIPVAIIAIFISLGITPLLQLIGQSESGSVLTGDYSVARAIGMAPLVAYFVINETMRICGRKNMALVVLVIGLGINFVANWLVLYTPLASLFVNPASAVAYATVFAHVIMVGISGTVLIRVFRVRVAESGATLVRPSWGGAWQSATAIGRVAPGVGVRHANDYVGSIVPILLISTISLEVSAAVVVASKMYSVLCRVPQACFSTSFVFYGYSRAVEPNRTSTAKKLLIYSSLPTLVACVAALIFSGPFATLLGSRAEVTQLTQWLFVAYLLYIPCYIIEQFYGELLTVEQAAGTLAKASTVFTYMLSIPLAIAAVVVFEDPFLAVLSKGIPTLLLGLFFWRSFRKMVASVNPSDRAHA